MTKLEDLISDANKELGEETKRLRLAEKNYAIEWLLDNNVDVDGIDKDQYPIVVDGKSVIIAEKIGSKHTYARALTICSVCKVVVWTGPYLSIKGLAKAIASGEACHEHLTEECLIKNKEIPTTEEGYPVPPSWRKK